MKLLYQILLLDAVICSTLGHAFFFKSVRTVTDADCAGKSGYYCKGCHELLFCPPEGSPLDRGSAACKIMDPMNPFCAETGPGKATCQAASTCPQQSDALPIAECKRVGRYPDPLNCGMYQQCSAIGQKAVQYGCPVGTRFDPKKEICYKPTTPTAPGCYSFSVTNGLCKGMYLKTVLHPIRQDVSVVCNVGYKTQTCKSVNEQFDSTTHECVFKCQEEGFFADSNSDEHFYTCVKDGTKWIQSRQSCNPGETTGMKFDDSKGFCVANDPSNSSVAPPASSTTPPASSTATTVSTSAQTKSTVATDS